MKQIVLGTAGHIDHGKTSLIKALTGIDTDRLKEEKERGITIELGFAHLTLPSGQRVGIVDVPGHEKFVKNMVAGATGIDLVALVIAADEGVMPQTREHLEICQLLNVQHGLVVLTKIDMVESDWLELVKEDLSEYLKDTFLAGAPIAEVSSLTGEGLKELMETLDRMVAEIPERAVGHLFRLPADRVFTMKGFGTVITGTTVSGRIHTGDEATLYPQNIPVKIRGIQVHSQEVTEVRAGLRTAINLQGVEKAAVRRGNILAGKDALRSTFMVDVRLSLLKSVPRKLKNRAKVRFHTGTSEIISTVVLLDTEELEPGKTGFAQIRLEEPTTVLRQDPYVLRSYSPVRTIGGGEILHPLPGKKKRFSQEALADLKSLHKGKLEEIIELFVSSTQFQGLEAAELPFLTNTPKKQLEEALKRLQARQRIVQYDKERGGLIHADILKKARDEMVDTIGRYHKDFPLRSGLPKEELRSRITGARNPKFFNFILNNLTQDGKVALEKDVVRLEGHRITLARDQQETRQELETLYLDSGLQPPYFKEIRDKFPGNTAAEILEVMVKEGVLLKVKEDLYFHSQVVAELKQKLVDFLKQHQEINTPQFKEMTDASRKYTIPLLEYFDLTHVTVRVGDNRVLRKQ
jgi:selenocysteine-specific elongation factor